MRTLKFVFTLDNKKTVTCSLADPREGLTEADVTAVANEIIAQKVLVVGSAFPDSIKRIYIQDSSSHDILVTA